MVGCGWKCMRPSTNVGLWMELSEGSDQWSIVDENV